MGKVIIDKNIVADPNVCHGKPTFKGTRVMVWQVLELLEAGESPEEIYASYPTLPAGAVEAALRYAVAKVRGVSYVPFSREKPLQTQISA